MAAKESCVAVQHGNERLVFSRWFDLSFGDGLCTTLRQPGQGIDRALQESADLSARMAAFIRWKSLPGISQHELIALFDDITTLGELSLHWFTPAAAN